MIDLRQGDCLDLMKSIPNGSIDLILTDPPFGITACKWDSVIPLNLMWLELKRIIKPNGVIALFGSEPFSSNLRMSNIKQFKYDWIWDKGRGYNFAGVKYQPFKSHEIVSVFSKNTHLYNPQMTEGKPYTQKQGRKGEVYGGDNGRDVITVNNGTRYPLSIQKFIRGKCLGDHPTQKPIDFLEYLIKTYTNEGDTVLDFTAGSMSTAIACINTNRKGIMIEMDEHYFNVGKQRVEQAILDKENRINQAAENSGFLLSNI